MCGVCFYFSSKSSFNEEMALSLESLTHRGPDDSGMVYKEINGKHVGLGHRRLSILDLSRSGRQPMTLGDGVTVTFNGEIYNYRELRAGLESMGYSFKTGTDTEVILYVYKKYGAEGFSLFRGMFAIILFDELKKKVYLVRDLLGIKPIYIYNSKDAIFACSEIKALNKFSDVSLEVSEKDVFEFFNNGFLYEPSTGFKGVRKILPGHYLEIDIETGDEVESRFSSLDFFTNDRPLPEVIGRSVRIQENADAQLGVFFSGGVDSTILAKLSENSKLVFAKYTGDESPDSELNFARRISEHLGKELEIVDLGSSDLDADSILETFDFVARNTEELVSDYTFWSTYKLSQAASKKGYKVMLSGMGGDEVFAGYPRYMVVKYDGLVRFASFFLSFVSRFKLFPKSINKRFDRLLSYSKEKSWPIAYSRLLGYFTSDELRKLFSDYDSQLQKFSENLNGILADYTGDESDKVKLAQHLDLVGFLSHNLTVSDKASMLASIELRVPLLDEEVVAQGISKSTRDLIINNQLKSPLKSIFSSFLPKKLLERPKVGFNPPLDGLINRIGSKRIKRELSCLSSIFDIYVINGLVDHHFSGRANNTYKIWQLLYFAKWLNCRL